MTIAKVMTAVTLASQRRVLAGRIRAARVAPSPGPVADVPAVAAPDAAAEQGRIEAAVAERLAGLEAEARAAIEEERRAARESGYAQGLAQGAAAAEARAERERGERLAAIDALLDLIARTQAEALAANAEAAAALGFAAACRILGDRLVSLEGVRRVVAEAIASAGGEGAVRVRLAPADHALLAPLAATPFAGRGVELAADGTLARGGCIVETEAGTLDARLETQLDALREALLRSSRSETP